MTTALGFNASEARSFPLDEEAKTGTGGVEHRPIAGQRGWLIRTILSAAMDRSAAFGTLHRASSTNWALMQAAAQSATIAPDSEARLMEGVRELFEAGKCEFFEDGIDSAFSRGLLSLLAREGRAGIRAVEDYLQLDEASPSVASEALRWIAEHQDRSTYRERWSILATALRNQSAMVRDGAVIGFAIMDDPRARRLLAEAMNQTQPEELRQLIESAIKQLDSTANAASPAQG